ncbi:MAG: hypothetical protein M0P94_05315 [Candidatus Absconditabacterales bacterium]|nr:hypothetical protein [Candidatus Absconditabacterales bacterium]
MRKNQMVFIGQRGCTPKAEKYDPEKWNGSYFYAICLEDLIAYKRKLNQYEYPEISFYVVKEGGRLQMSEIYNIKNLLEFTNKQLREFFN